MAAEGGVVAEFLVFYCLLAGADCIEKVRLMVDNIAVVLGHAKDFGFFLNFRIQRTRQRVLGLELF